MTNNGNLSGRAGALFLLRLIRTWIPSSANATTAAMQPLIKHTLAHKPWNYNDTECIGAAHGNKGIITQIVLSDPSHATVLESNIKEMLSMQTLSEHWSCRPNRSDEANLVHSCHEALVLIISFVALRPYLPTSRERVDEAVALAREDVWRRGVLTKEPNLCHGNRPAFLLE